MFTVIAENINIMSKRIGASLKGRDPKPVRELVERLLENGADALDLNLGPARREGTELMPWLVRTVQEVCACPLFLDTSNVEAIAAGLATYRPHRGRAVINSISARPERMQALFPLAARHGAGVVALVLGEEGIPRDANERAANAALLMAGADEAGLAHEDVWIDPIVVPVSSQQPQVASAVEFLGMLKEMAPGYRVTCGLSNVSNGVPDQLRPLVNRCYLLMLRHRGLDSAILDGLDGEIIALARGGRPDLEKLVGAVMDGEPVDPQALDPEQLQYFKTTRLLCGQTLYSDSWLQL